MLPEDTLLEIFDYYRLLDAMEARGRPKPWKWHRLAHVCQKWRLVISMSPRRLDLQILCRSGAPIECVLASWGTLPLIVRFKGSPKTKSLPENIVTALRHPDRVREIELGLTSTTVGSIVDSIKKPFQTLECIRITIKDAKGPSLLFRNAFLGGSAPCLKEIELDGINFPFSEIKQVISSTNNLTTLHLSRIQKTGYFSADDLVTALSTSTQLGVLTVNFQYPVSLPTQSGTSPPFQRATLPSLYYLKFRGASEYLEDFVSRVNIPSLGFIKIMLFNQIFFDIPQFCHFILWSPLKSPTEVEITLYTDLVTIFIRQRSKRREIQSVQCHLETACERLDWQLSFVTQVSSQLSPLLKSVQTLTVSHVEMPNGEDMDSMQWLEVFHPFAHVRELRVSEKLALDIVQALVTEDTTAEALPELTRLRIFVWEVREPGVVEAVEKFVAARKLSGRTIHVSEKKSG